MYILSADTGNPNNIHLETTISERTKFYGSKEFINVSNVCPFLTTAYQIESDKLENVLWDGWRVGIICAKGKENVHQADKI